MSVQKREWIDAAGRRRKAYRVRWQEGQTWRSRTFARDADAKAFNAELVRLKRLGTLAQLDSGSETLEEYVAGTWVPTFAAPLSMRTRRDYAQLYERHLARDLGHIALRNLTPELLQRWYAEQLSAGAGPTRVRKALALLSHILQRAFEADRVQRNAARLVRPARRAERAKVRPLAPVTIEAIREAMLNPQPTTVAADRAGQRPRAAHTVAPRGNAQSRQRDALLVSLMAYAGLRPGEALALRWDDIGEESINVERAVSMGQVKATKTGTTRSVRLLSPLAADLREFRMASGRPAPGVLLVPGADGAVWTETAWGNWSKRQWARALKGAGLGSARPYDLRHSFASLLLHEGRSVVYVARQLGHGAQLTLGTYGHVIDELDDAPNIDAVAAIMGARDKLSAAHQLPKVVTRGA
jgi:integrase